MTNAELKARKLISERTTEQLVSDFGLMETRTYTHIKQRKKRDRAKEICVWLLAIKFLGRA